METTVDLNKIKVSREELKLVEHFMWYAEGHLSEWITWNDVMPVVQKIKSLEKDWPIATESVLSLFIWNKIEDVWMAVVEFIKLYFNTLSLQH